jgi:hypothetical protein
MLATGGCQLIVNLDGLEDRSCPPGFKACVDSCVRNDDPTTGCNDPFNCNPCPAAHAVAICDSTLQCSFNRQSCSPGWDDCTSENGCETDLAHNRNHCGACNEVCAPLPNAVPACANGKCVVGSCVAGYEDCDPDPLNGCETKIWTDQACATCRSPCAEGTHCVQGGFCRPNSDGGDAG